MSSIHQKIQQQIDKTPEGAIIFPTNFRGLGTDDAIRQALSRLVKGGRDRSSGTWYILHSQDTSNFWKVNTKYGGSG